MEPSYHVDVLRGRCQELPEVRSKVVRVFVSSTFSDTLAERDSLIDTVFPKLKTYCREKYGLEFQYSDMRWGIQSESADNHGEVETCLNEIKMCQKYSVATNFVVLLSHRYGSRPTPATIHASLFEQLHQIVSSDPYLNDDAELLSQWYQKDTNCVPAAYVLRPTSTLLPNIKSNDSHERKQASKEWTKINDRIRTCLRQAATKSLEQGQISAGDYDDFFISVTEKEIVNGILSASNVNQRTLCFLREIEDIQSHLSDSKASKFIDVNSSNDDEPIIDQEAEQLLTRLKYTRIPNALQSNNIFSYKVHWTPKGINRHDHAEYIAKFNEDFYNAIIQQIDSCVKSRIMIVSDPLHHEILEHAIQCKTYVAKFHGRTDVLNKLEKHIKNDNENRPCAVYGASGCGKTSVIAKAATEALKWWSDRSVSVILRFLGTTPSSSTVYKTILSISHHICKLYNLSMQIYPDVQQLRHQLANDLLIRIPDDEYLIILLDSIDQLETDAYDCQWLPGLYPHNVKCIASTLPDHGNILLNLKSIMNYNPTSPQDTEDILIHVPAFEASTVDLVYNDWLAMKKRSLSDEQRSFIRDLMKEQTAILPLYMKLMFDIISTWHSYDSIDVELKRLKTVDDCIRYLFNRLKVIHNAILFQRAICYMTACRNGISQNELEDVLSLDDDVLISVFEHYIPPIRRIPGILWTRIRNDLDEYITEKEVDDSSVIYWYHRRFIEVANAQYISKMSSNERTAVFENMVDLYKETWKGKNKPFKIYDPKLVRKYNLDGSNGEIQANRFTTSQPTEFIDANGRVQFNKRKLNELPQFLGQLTTNLSIPIAADEVFFNYSFMRAKVVCSTFNDILNDFQTFKNASAYRLSPEVIATKKELDILSMLYLIVGAQIQEYPENYPFEISVRLLALFSIKPHVTNLIKQLDEQSVRHFSLIVPYCQLQPPGSGLIFSMNRHTTSIVDMDFTDDQMVLISLSDRIVVIDMQATKTVLDINLPTLDEPYLNSTTLPDIYQFYDSDEVEKDTSSNDKNDEYKKYLFLVNSLHHIYLVSAQENIKFERSSSVGYATAEVLHRKRALCIIAEINGNYIECWDVARNRLFDRIDFPMSKIRNVLCIKTYSMIVTVLQDGIIHIHSVMDWKKSSFVYRGSIQGGPHLGLVVADGEMLIITFDATVPIDFAIVDLKQFHSSEQVLSDSHVLKTLMAFDPPIGPKPIKSIILPDKEAQSKIDSHANFPLFICKTNDCLFVVHKCNQKYISYVRINGRFDIVSTHAKNPHTIYTSRGGTIELHKWACGDIDDDSKKNNHKYQLYVSIDISASPVTSIKASAENEFDHLDRTDISSFRRRIEAWTSRNQNDSKIISSLFLCSMENGVIQAYFAKQARDAYKSMPSFPRTNEVIRTVQLFQKTAITLDGSKRELTTWSYQHATSIESTRLFLDDITVNEFAVVSSTLDCEIIFVLILTNNHWIEIYSAKSLKREPLFSLDLRSPSWVHSTPSGSFYVLTNKGSIYCIAQQVTSDTEIIFNQTANTQLNIQCSMMRSSVLTLSGLECLIVLADNGQSMAIWTLERIVYIDIDVSPYVSSAQLKSVLSEQRENVLLLYFNNQTLISVEVNLDISNHKGHVQLSPFGEIDKFCLKKHSLAVYNKGKTQLNLHNLCTHTSYDPIQLDNQCQELCLNESGTYVFALVKPRVLFMYRIEDRRQLAKLFVYDFVSFMIADNDFLVLAMNDRRLLTLMIADPDDPTLQARIAALPSRNLQRSTGSAAAKLVEHMEKCANFSSDDDEKSDFEGDDTAASYHPTNKGDTKASIKSNNRPVSCFRFVTRLNGRHALSKMSSDNEMSSKVMATWLNQSETIDIGSMVDDSDSEIHDDDNDVESPNRTDQNEEQQHVDIDLNSIHQKTLEYDQQQIKGIQFTNAGDGNLKVVNNYVITSNTCTLV
ncbi:unnamed protein product [Rotaria socialis]|uniref:DUF4062 domain-containing protein n=1 Tax=Rotaria socialis TaxID=392032 RepID=A0A821EUR7_9BILA|nr:unnamed protein product [Rotaria socialis]